MEQRKRESLVPKGAFGGATTLDDSQRGDVSGTFLRSEHSIPPAPIPAPRATPPAPAAASPVARIELKRRPLPPPAPAAPRKSMRPVPPVGVPASSVVLPPPPPVAKVPTTTPEPMTLRALVAPSYPPPAPVAETPERINFEELALRLDIAPIAPPPASLLPVPQEVSAEPKDRRVVAWVALLLALGAIAWSSRGLFMSSSPRVATNVQAPPALKPAVVDATPARAVELPVAAPAEPSTVAVAEVPVVDEVAPVSVVAPPPAAVETRTVESMVPVTAEATRAPRAIAPARQTTTLAAESTSSVVSADQAAPSVTPAAPVVTEAVAQEVALAEPLPEVLEREEVIEGIELLRNEYKTCAGDLHGTAELRITIAGSGRITHALVGGDYAGTPQGSCLARTLRQARFRAFQQSRLDIVYPLAL